MSKSGSHHRVDRVKRRREEELYISHSGGYVVLCVLDWGQSAQVTLTPREAKRLMDLLERHVAQAALAGGPR